MWLLTPPKIASIHTSSEDSREISEGEKGCTCFGILSCLDELLSNMWQYLVEMLCRDLLDVLCIIIHRYHHPSPILIGKVLAQLMKV